MSRIGGRTGDGYISPDEQRRQIQAFADLMGVEIDQWHDDQDYSGGNLQRPGFIEAIRRIEEGESGGLIVARIDRFARSAPDGGVMVRRILDAGALFASAQERIDPTTDFGKFGLTILFAMAELQLDQLKTGWKTAKARAVARGAHIGPTPTGYDRIAKTKPGSGALVPNADAPAMSALFEKASETTSDSALAHWMDECHPRGDGRPWSPVSIRHILTNRVYLGEVRYGDLLNAEAHEPLIDHATWRAAQRRPGEQRRATGGRDLLAGLVRCSACRYRMSPGPGGHKGATRVYRCMSGSRGCPEPSVVVTTRLEEFVTATARREWEERQAGLMLRAVQDDGGALEDIAQRLNEAREELEAFALDVTARRLLAEHYHAGLEARSRAAQELEEEFDRALARSEAADLRPLDWDDLTADELREVLAAMVDVVWLRRAPRGAAIDERVWITWAGDAPDDLPGPGRPNTTLTPFPWPDEHDPVAGEPAA